MRTGPSGKQFDDEWREIPDDTPVSVSVDLRPKSMEQMVALYVQQAMVLKEKMSGAENADEAEDLEVDDEGDSELLTPYELHALAAEAEREARRRAWIRENIGGRNKRPKGDGDGRSKVEERAGEPGLGGKTLQADGKPIGGSAAADRKETPGAVESPRKSGE